jgi:sialate O-acetylesterase
MINFGGMKKYLSLFLFILLAVAANAKIVPAKLFQDGMVLQRGKTIKVWGTASPRESFVVSIGKNKVGVVADENGRWHASLPKMIAGGPYILYIGNVEIKDVLVGDVWLCSGQSNMDVMVSRVYPQYTTDIDNYSNDKIRLFRAEQRSYVDNALHDVTTLGWRKANKKDAWNFSALGYYLARKMFERTHVPHGIICNSWGGTPIEAWVSRDSLQGDYPLLCNRTALYSHEYVEAQRKANNIVTESWNKALDKGDKGLSEHWASCEYNDAAWAEHNQFSKSWSTFKGQPVVGAVWVRQHIKVDAAHAGKEALLNLGTLYDMDYAYVNGKQVGVTYYQYPPRRYNVPAGVLHEGDNVVAIRFITKQGSPSFTHGKKYQLEFTDGSTIKLSETWKSNIGCMMPPLRTMDVSTQNLPYVLYNSMLLPLAPYSVAGVVWYQGESNAGNPDDYLPMLRKLKGSWRALWNDADMPFSIVQLANFMEPSEKPQYSGWAGVREAQRLSTVEDNRSELAVALDLGEWNDIHPLRKREVAERVALSLRRMVYGDKVELSPQVVSAKREGDKVVLLFDQPLQQCEAVGEMELAGGDGKYLNVAAAVSGKQVVVTIPENLSPSSVRYAWKNNPSRANIRGAKSNLPASSFQMKLQ